MSITLKNDQLNRTILVADVAGFCFGVRRAVDMVSRARADSEGLITMLGPLVHNPQVVDRMRDAGVGTVDSLQGVEGGTVVLSAHGVAPAVRERAIGMQLKVLDVTCPFVTKVHRMAKQLVEQGYQLLIAGDHGHTEVKGVLGSVDGNATVVSCVEEVERMELGKKVGVVSQTTQGAANYVAIVAEAARRAPDVRAVNTICGATDELQDAAIKLAREAEVVIVVGGRSSANTRRLRDSCERQGTPAYHIESVEEIESGWLEGKQVIGVTAGASTPDWLIEEVVAHLNGGSLPSGFVLRHPDE